MESLTDNDGIEARGDVDVTPRRGHGQGTATTATGITTNPATPTLTTLPHLRQVIKSRNDCSGDERACEGDDGGEGVGEHDKTRPFDLEISRAGFFVGSGATISLAPGEESTRGFGRG